MKYSEALLKIRQLGNKAQEHADTAERASRTYGASMELFNVAADAGDEPAMEKLRVDIHQTVDSILDSGAMIGKLKAQQKEIALSVTDWPPT